MSLLVNKWINVRDKVAPVFDCSSIADITIEQTHPDCLLSADEVALPTLVATDNCDVAVTGRLHNQISAYAMGLNTIIWYFTDNAGNETACKQNITVIDKAAPEVDCSALTTVTAELTTPGCRLDSSRVRLVTPFVSDNCGEPIKGTLISCPPLIPLGDTVITWHSLMRRAILPNAASLLSWSISQRRFLTAQRLIHPSGCNY